MAYEPKDGSGALFKNDKQGNDKRPDYRGDIVINGQAYFLSAWLKTSNSGTKFMSLSAQPKDDKAAPKPAEKPRVSFSEEEERRLDQVFGLDDDIPF